MSRFEEGVSRGGEGLARRVPEKRARLCECAQVRLIVVASEHAARPQKFPLGQPRRPNRRVSPRLTSAGWHAPRLGCAGCGGEFARKFWSRRLARIGPLIWLSVVWSLPMAAVASTVPYRTALLPAWAQDTLLAANAAAERAAAGAANKSPAHTTTESSGT